MNTALDNQSALAAMFAPGIRATADFNAGRMALAEAQVKRAQDLQDQQTVANLKRELTNAQIAADDRRTQMYLERQIQAGKDADEREKARIASQQKLLDDRQNAEEAKATRAAVRIAYDKYKKLGGARKLAEFGAENSADTLYAINDELGPLQQQRSIDSFAGQARVLRQLEDSIASMTSITPDDEAAARNAAVEGLMGDKRFSDGIGYYSNTLGRGASPELAMNRLQKRDPVAAGALRSQISMLLSQRASEKAQSKDYLLAERQAGELRSGLVKFAQDRELPASSLDLLFGPTVQSTRETAEPASKSGQSNLELLRKSLRSGGAQLSASVSPQIAASALPQAADDGQATQPNGSAQDNAGGGAPWQLGALALLHPGKVVGGLGGGLRALLSAGRLAGQAIPVVRAGTTGYLIGDALNNAPTWFGGRRITDYGVNAAMGTYDDWRAEGDASVQREADRMRNMLTIFAPDSPTAKYALRRLGELQFQLPRANRDQGAIDALMALRNASAAPAI